MLIVLLAIDAGRLFFGWENLQNAARIGANYAANNPLAWSANPNASQQAQYTALIEADTTTINCALASPPSPQFPDGATNADGSANLGGRAVVNLTCAFTPFSPFIGAIIGNPVQLGASSTFPIKGGIISTVVPTPVPSASVAPSVGPSAGPSAGPTPSPAPCQVPVFTGTKVNNAAGTWARAGFIPSNLTESLGNGNYTITSETPPGVDGTQQVCATFKLTVGP